MKKECNIVRDILPLYVENIVSADTREFVEAHLETCPECRAEREKAASPAAFVADTDAAPLRHIRKKLTHRKLRLVILTAALVLVAAIAAVSALSAPNYLSWKPDLVRVTEHEHSQIILSFAPEVTGYSVFCESDAELNLDVYRLQAWNCAWDRSIAKRPPVDDFRISVNRNVAVVYVSCDGTADSVLYHNIEIPDDDTSPLSRMILGHCEIISLPRLVLGYYLLLAALAAAALGGLWYALRRREKAGRALMYLFFVPVSYVAAHLLVKGAALVTYAAQRDLSLMLLVALPLYVAAVCAAGLLTGRKKL